MNIVENGHRLRHIRIVDCVIAIYVVHNGWGDGTPVWPSPVIIIYSSVHICLQSVESGPCLFFELFFRRWCPRLPPIRAPRQVPGRNVGDTWYGRMGCDIWEEWV